MKENLEPDHILIYQGKASKAMDFSLLLASQNIPHWLESDKETSILVEKERAEESLEIIRLYREENKGFGTGNEIPPSLRTEPLLLLVIPSVVFFWSMGHPFAWKIKELGLADAQKILDGEWWRTITALTLHADLRHFLGNLISGFFVLTLLSQRTSAGAMVPGLILSSAVANGLVALITAPDHRSLGFSTAVFGALGALAGQQLRHSWTTHGHLFFQQFKPLFSAFFVVLMLGLGPESDILAHFFGMACGFLLGLFLPQKKRSAPLTRQFIWVLGTWAFVFGCWQLAIG